MNEPMQTSERLTAYQQLALALVHLEEILKRDQPRVPRGQPEGGQFSSDGGGGGDGELKLGESRSYKLHLIRRVNNNPRDPSGDYTISKEGQHLSYSRSLREAKKIIDMLVG